MTRFGLFIVSLATLTSALGQVQGQTQKNPVVVMDTSQGKITIELFESKAPIAVKNFLRYVDEKHYDGTIFHRVIPDFMIQGGGMEPGLKEKKTHDGIKNESTNGLSNERGTLAMARRIGEPDSATSQFFINVKDNVRLDKAKADDRVGYAVFGKVIEGMDVVDKIRRVETRTVKGATAADPDHDDVPVTDVIIRSVRRK